MSLTVPDGTSVVFDPSDVRRISFDWDGRYLDSGVQIMTSTFSIVVITQNGATVLTKDNESVLAGNRITQLRLNATTATHNDKYRVNNQIVTNETPSQTFERSFFVLVLHQ